MPFQARNANYNALRKLSLRERLAAASDTSMGQVLISMLSPTQAAELFPKYWIERNPDIGGFIKAIPTSLSAAKQKEYEQQIQNTASGDSAGANYAAGGYRKKWQEEIKQEQQRSQITRKGERPTPQLSPEQKQSFDALKAGDINVNDERMKWLKNAPQDVLKEVGINIVKDDKGNERFHYTAPQVSEAEVKKSMIPSGNFEQKSATLIPRLQKDLGITREQAAGILGSLGAETGGLKAINELHPLVPGSRGGFGWAQWTGPRRKEFETFAANRSLSITSDEANYQFLVHELKTSENRALQQLKKTTSVEEAARTFTGSAATGIGYLRPGKEHYESSVRFAQRSYGTPTGDPITQNYTPQQIAARQREMESAAEAGRLSKLATATQPVGPVNAVGPIPEYKGTIPGHFGKNEQCASLSKHFAPGIGAASGWKFNNDASAIQPGAVIATTTYGHGPHPGGIEASKTPDGKSHYHTGIALTKPNAQGEVLILEQFNGQSPRVHKVNVNNYNGEQMRVVLGGEPSASTMQAVAIGRQLAPQEQAWIDSDSGARPPIQESERKTSLPDSEKKKVTTSETDTSAPATPSTPAPPAPSSDAIGIKPLTSITQPQGPVNAAGPATPAQQPQTQPQTQTQPTAAVEQPKPAAPAKPTGPTPERYNVDTAKFINRIKQTEDFKSNPLSWMATDSMIINGFNDDARVKAAGVHLDEKGVMHFKQGMTDQVKEVMSGMDAKSFMTKIEEQKKETPKVEASKPATQVKAMAEGGDVPVSTEKISAYPIGGLRGDNAVVVNAQQKPLFTMNTNESVLMEPDKNRAQVLPDKKSTNVGPTPTSDTSSGMMEEFRSSINEIKQDFASLKASKVSQPILTPTSPSVTENGWISKMSQSSAETFKNPTARRVAYRAGGMETGEPYSNFHYSRGNNS